MTSWIMIICQCLHGDCFRPLYNTSCLRQSQSQSQQWKLVRAIVKGSRKKSRNGDSNLFKRSSFTFILNQLHSPDLKLFSFGYLLLDHLHENLVTNVIISERIGAKVQIILVVFGKNKKMQNIV